MFFCPPTAGAVFVSTEDAFPSRRLQQLIGQQQQLRTDVPADVLRRIPFGDRIFVEHVADVVRALWGVQPRSRVHGQGWGGWVHTDPSASQQQCVPPVWSEAAHHCREKQDLYPPGWAPPWWSIWKQIQLRSEDDGQGGLKGPREIE